MNKDIIRGLYIAAEEYCVHENRKEAWLFEKKFAELIVKECVAVSMKSSLRSNDMGAVIAQNISIHFGLNSPVVPETRIVCEACGPIKAGKHTSLICEFLNWIKR